MFNYSEECNSNSIHPPNKRQVVCKNWLCNLFVLVLQLLSQWKEPNHIRLHGGGVTLVYDRLAEQDIGHLPRVPHHQSTIVLVEIEY